MKHVYIILLVVFISCSSDDDNNRNDTISISGEWNIVNITGGFTGMDQDFEQGTIVWNFNESIQMVTVINNNTIDGVYDGLPSGTYPYVISVSTDELIVNENSLGFIQLTSTNLIVMEAIRDGFTIKFER